MITKKGKKMINKKKNYSGWTNEETWKIRIMADSLVDVETAKETLEAGNSDIVVSTAMSFFNQQVDWYQLENSDWPVDD